MSSANISFNSIPSSIRKPGQYLEFNTSLAVRTLPANTQKVLILAPMLASGTKSPLEAVSVFSADEAALYFGYGSLAHLMCNAAINTYAYLDLTMIGISDAAAGLAASGTLTVTGPATAQGVLTLWVGNTRVDVAVSAADTAAIMAAAMKSAIDNLPELPVTAAAADGVVTLTAKNKGLSGNGISLRAQTTASGTTTVIAAMAGGDVDPDLTAALASVFAGGHNIIISPFATQTALTVLRTHLDSVSGPMEQRGAVGVAGWPASLATGITLADSLNSGRITVGWHNSSVLLPAEIAAAYGAAIASEEDPARPLNTLTMALDVTDITSRPGRTEQESALHNGLTPFEVGSGDVVQIVRAITTYTQNSSGVDDVALLDLTTIRTLDYVRKACRERIALRFPRSKLSSRTPPLVKSELYDVLLKLEELEILEAVEDNKDGLIVERDSQDVNRLDARIPADVVNGLHVFAGRIDLLL
ncbi:phage tail sheath subtilisin-like domain-containing protein [Candidatus Pantoea formicae]|uniref:phage tail sheath subtilisin-like domain-containing protein n=1 Tax=Candidatus Pantoea formicae TaxID=2608355 RepID=UPI003EDAB00C